MPPPTWTITVTKDTNNNLKYTSGGANAKSQHVNPADRVSWTSPDGHIAVLFKDSDSPAECKQSAFAADMGESTPARKIKSLKAAERPSKPFPYAVAHLDANNVLTTEDPDLIIDDPGGGGGTAGSGGGAVPAAGPKTGAKAAKTAGGKGVKKTVKKAAPKRKTK